MKPRTTAKSQTPLDPPLSGGKSELPADIYHPSKKPKTAPPLKRVKQAICAADARTRGGREGFAFVSYNKKLTALARENRKQPTVAESKLWYQLLRMRNLSAYKFTRQKTLANFIVDFYCAELRLAIEIDGDSHAGSFVYDSERTMILSNLGITVVRYTNDDVLNNLQGVYVDLIRTVELLKGMS